MIKLLAWFVGGALVGAFVFYRVLLWAIERSFRSRR